MSLYEVFHPIGIICVELRQCNLSSTDIFDASVRNLRTRTFLLFLVFGPFSQRLAGFATPNGGESDLHIQRIMQHYDLWIASPYITKGCASRNTFIQKEKSWAQTSRKVKTLKALKETPKCVYGPSDLLNMGMNNVFLPLMRRQNNNNKKKENSKPLIVICAILIG